MACLKNLFIPGYRLRNQLVPGCESTPVLGRLPYLDQHLLQLEDEFAGSTQLELLHARTVVLLRRKIRLRHNRSRFRRLWFWHGRFLAQRLNSRWLVSAADTFIDHPRDSTEQATALAAVLLTNTVKLYESELRLLEVSVAEGLPISQGAPEPLFDGLTTYLNGRGDLLRNLDRRMSRVNSRNRPANLILGELMKRLRQHNSVFARLS